MPPEHSAKLQLAWIQFVGVGTICLLGCTGRAERAAAPAWSPGNMGQAAVEQFDTSGDGQIDPKELTAAPGLAEALPVVDSDHSGTISAAEVTARIELYQKLRTAYADMLILVYVDNRPLRNACVKLVPEKFQGDALTSATGLTDYQGKVSPQAVGSSFSGVQPGFYRVELFQDEAGTKPIAVKKPLGVEASGTSRPDRDMVAILKFESGG